MERTDWRNFFLSLGVGLICAGVPTVLMEHSAYFVPGLLIAIIGIGCVGISIFIKQSDYYFWEYLERTSNYCLKQAYNIDVHNANQNETLIDLFIAKISKAIDCYYLPPKSKEIKDTLKGICTFHRKRNKRNKQKANKEIFEKFWAYLTTFYEFRHQSAYRNPNFNPKELESCEIFEREGGIRRLLRFLRANG